MTTTCWIFCPNGDCGGGGGGATAGPAPPHPLEFTSNPAASRHAAAGRTRIGFRGRIIARTPWFSKACPYQPGHAYLVVLMWPRPVSVWGREILGSRKPPELGVPVLVHRRPPSGILSPFATHGYHLRLTTAVLPPRGRLDGNCPSGQVAGAIRAGYARNYRPIHQISFGRRDAQPQDFACPNTPPV